MIALLALACGSPSDLPPGPPVLVETETSCEHADACTVACNNDEALACNQLGLWLHDGMQGAVQDREAAAASYRKACDLGAGIGCYNLAHMLEQGDGVDEDPMEAKELLEQSRRQYQASCDAGALTWCTNLAGLLQRGELGPADPRAARALLERTCDKGDTLACVELAENLFSGVGGKPDPEKGEALLTRACDAGSQPACNNLGARVRDRGGDAEPIFRASCEAGVAVACRNLARLVPDRNEALALLDRACNAATGPDGVACAMSAEILLERPGNEAEAADRLARACSVGIAPACVQAARLEPTGKTSLTPETARTLLERGCTLKDRVACQLLEDGTK